MTMVRRAATLVLASFALLAVGMMPALATKITQVVSPGGIRAWLVQEPLIPMISMQVAWRGGSALDPAGREGTANMVSGLLDEGAGELDSQTFQTRLEDLAVGLGFNAGRDTFYGNLKTLTKNRDEAFALFGMAVTAPRFDTEPVERIRRQIVTSLIREEEDPNTIASRAWFAKAFPGHPYGRPGDGTVESVKAITVDDLRSFASSRLARDNMLISVVGDITHEELGRLLDKSLGGLPVRSEPVRIAEATLPSQGSVTVIEKDIPQSVVVFGSAGIKRNDPDWYAAYVLNYVLGGGGFTSRLMQEVRVKRGLAYSVYTYLYPMDRAAVLLGGVGTRNSRVAETLAQVRKEIARLRDGGVTPEELADAKTYLNGSFPLRLSSNASIASLMLAMQLDDLGTDYLDRRAGFINAVTEDDISRVAARLLHPEKLIVVVVGKPDGLISGE